MLRYTAGSSWLQTSNKLLFEDDKFGTLAEQFWTLSGRNESHMDKKAVNNYTLLSKVLMTAVAGKQNSMAIEEREEVLMF